MPSSKALKKSTSWEITHAFYFAVCFCFFESRKLLLKFVATPLYLYFSVLLCQGKVANAKLLVTFVAVVNRMFFVTVSGIKKSKTN